MTIDWGRLYERGSSDSHLVGRTSGRPGPAEAGRWRLAICGISRRRFSGRICWTFSPKLCKVDMESC